ncbi:hypothetical protein GH733_007664 [Mirounga leonina]|nr:hypothetical protein GH733_007664 [Mirounga leonina]
MGPAGIWVLPPDFPALPILVPLGVNISGGNLPGVGSGCGGGCVSGSLMPTSPQAFLVYAAGVYSNMGNYKSFGDTKFVPNLPKEKLERVILGSEAAQQHPEEVRSLWQTCRELMFSLEPRLRHLGLGKEVRPPNRTGEWRASFGVTWHGGKDTA